jgi:folate-binding protein YgfZ
MASNEGIQVVVRRDRAFVSVTGPEARDFLQGLLSQDVERVRNGHAAYGALLTPQGKFLHDLFLTEHGDGVLLECEADRADDLALRLKRYKLRAKVDLEILEGWATGLVWGGDPFELGDTPGASAERDGATLYVDPRLAALGIRVVGPELAVVDFLSDLPVTDQEAFARHRLQYGVPEGQTDIVVDRGFLLENGFDELNGVDWQKGCYVGQELTARTKYRGLVKRRLLPVRIEGAPPPPGEALDFEGKNAGEMRGAVGDLGLALVRLDAWRAAEEAGAAITAGETKLWPHKPDWARF